MAQRPRENTGKRTRNAAVFLLFFTISMVVVGVAVPWADPLAALGWLFGPLIENPAASGFVVLSVIGLVGAAMISDYVARR